MTIRIKITNMDTRENAIVAVKVRGKTDEATSRPDTHIKGGESTEEYVHSDQRLIVEEVRNG